MLVVLIPALILVIGLLLYALASNGKVQEIGRIMFACGMLVTTWVLATRTVTLLH